MVDYQISFDRELDPTGRQEWQSFWEQSVHSYPTQHYVYGEVERAKNRVPFYVQGKVDGRLAFIGIFSIQPLFGMKYSFEAICWRGPVFDDGVFGEWCLQEVYRHFSRLGVGSIRIGPNWTFPEAETVESLVLSRMGFSIYETWHRLGRRTTGIVPIDRSDEGLLQHFSTSTRREVRRAERQKVSVRAAENQQEADTFCRHLRAMHKERGLSCYSPAEFESLYANVISKQLGVIFNAYHGDEYLGGMMLQRSFRTVHSSKYVVLSERTRNLSNLRLAPIVWWHGMRWARDQGCTGLDLEGYSGDTTSVGHLQYIYEYKKGFQPNEIQVLGQYFKRCNKTLFHVDKIWQKAKKIPKLPGRVVFKLRTKLIRHKISQQQQGSQE
jgi:hypothetical protein